MVIFDISDHHIHQDICNALPGLHAITGCDTTSSFNGIGKVKCFKIMESEESFIDAMSLLGESLEMSNALVKLNYLNGLYADYMV